MNYWKLSTAILIVIAVIFGTLLEVNYYQREYQFGNIKLTLPELEQIVKQQQEFYNYTMEIAQICDVEAQECFIIRRVR